MNWLIYIAGWVGGWAIWNTLLSDGVNEKNYIFMSKLILWTMLWVWICWKFIK